MIIQNRVGQYRSGSWYQRNPNSITKITVHHSAIPLSKYSNDDDLLKFIQQIHEGNGWPGLSYHFVITKSGAIYQINDYRDVTWHDTKNWDSLGVLVNGYFHPDVNDKPTKAQLKSLDWLLDQLCTQHPEFPADHDDVVGHRERSATACPGDNLFPYVVEYRQKKGSVEWGNPEEDDGSMVGDEKPCEEKLQEIEDELDGVRSSRDKWRNKYEAEVPKLVEEVNTWRTNYETIQETAATQAATITDLQKENQRLSADVLQANERAALYQNERDAAVGVKSGLESTIERLKESSDACGKELKEEKAKVKTKIMSFTWWERFASLFRKR